MVAVVALSGCGTPSKQDVIDKTQGLKNKTQLRDTMGKPDEFSTVEMPLLGSVEEWTYKCSDGEVVFEIVNSKIKLKMAGK